MTVTGLRKEILGTSQQGRKYQTISGGRRVGAPSRWMVAPRPGDLGGVGRCKDRAKRHRRVKDVVGPWGRTEIHNTVEMGGAGGG